MEVERSRPDWSTRRRLPVGVPVAITAFDTRLLQQREMFLLALKRKEVSSSSSRNICSSADNPTLFSLFSSFCQYLGTFFLQSYVRVETPRSARVSTLQRRRSSLQVISCRYRRGSWGEQSWPR